MAKEATSRLKFNPPLGNLPALQWALVTQLLVDEAYQRSIEATASQTLIRKIAQHWNWDLCQPLVVSRRQDGTMYVIDGQHRLAAARLRQDIAQLPCVVVDYASAADEAASFVHLNQQRRPLGKLDVFKAAVASEDAESCAILAAIEEAGLTLASHTNHTAWQPGMIANIGGIQAAWRSYGRAATKRALQVLARAFEGEVLRYAGTIFPGIAIICSEDGRDTDLAELSEAIGNRAQVDWRTGILQRRARDPNLNFAASSAAVMSDAWSDWLAQRGRRRPVAALRRANANDVADALVHFIAGEDGTCWCDQCDMRVSRAQAEGCKSRFCSLRQREAA